MPGITKDISITLVDLIAAFNVAWTLGDRIELVRGLDLDAKNEDVTVKTIGSVFSNVDLDNITVSQLLILESFINEFKKKIDSKKNDIIKITE